MTGRAGAHTGGVSGTGLSDSVSGLGAGRTVESRFLAVNSYDDTLRVYDRGFGPAIALSPAPEAEPLELKAAAEDAGSNGTGIGEGAAAHAAAAAGGDGTGGSSVRSSAGEGLLSEVSALGAGSEGFVDGLGDESSIDSYAKCLHSLVGHRCVRSPRPHGRLPSSHGRT